MDRLRSVPPPAPVIRQELRRHHKGGHWTPEQEAYLRWLATPKPMRNGVRSKAAYARHAGVSRTTLYTWEALPGFLRAVEALRKEWEAEMDRLCEEMIAINMQLPGREGVRDRELWLRYRGLLTDRVQVRGTVEVCPPRTVEEVDAAIVEALSGEDEDLAAEVEGLLATLVARKS